MTSVLNQAWLQPVRMSRNILRWSAGAHKAAAVNVFIYVGMPKT